MERLGRTSIGGLGGGVFLSIIFIFVLGLVLRLVSVHLASFGTVSGRTWARFVAEEMVVGADELVVEHGVELEALEAHTGCTELTAVVHGQDLRRRLEPIGLLFVHRGLRVRRLHL